MLSVPAAPCALRRWRLPPAAGASRGRSPLVVLPSLSAPRRSLEAPLIQPPVHSSSLQELTLLDLIERTRHVSQRQVADLLGMSTTRVNRLLRRLVDEGLIEVEDEHVRPFNHRLTELGRARQLELAQEEARWVVPRFQALERKIQARLQEIHGAGLKRVVFYGAGEILDVALPLAARAGLDVVAIADDDPSRHGINEDGVEVVSGETVSDIPADAVVITTYRHADAIRARLGASGVSLGSVVEL